MNMKALLAAMRERFPGLYEEVRERHQEFERRTGGDGGHGFWDHDLVVAQYAIMFAPDPTTTEKAWVAAMLHSYDRMYAYPEHEIRSTLTRLPGLDPHDVKDILKAVERHDKPNAVDDSLLQIVLQDADRVANAAALVIIRTARLFPSIPAAETKFLSGPNPESTYRKPTSILESMRYVLEWENHPRFRLRLPKAQEIGRRHFDFIRSYIAQVESDFLEVGLASLDDVP